MSLFGRTPANFDLQISQQHLLWGFGPFISEMQALFGLIIGTFPNHAIMTHTALE